MILLSNRAMLYILIFIVLFFLLIDLTTLFFRGPNFDVVFYNSDVFFDYSEVATITTVSGLKFKSNKKKDDYLKVYKDTSRQTFEKYFSEVSKEINKNIQVVDVKYSWKDREDILEITESVTLKGLVSSKEENGTKVYTVGMGRIKMNAVGNANLKLHIPQGSIVLSVEPTPTVQNGDFLLWSNEDIIFFPEVSFKRSED
ncbi:MAG: DUF4897 domain-containing protein [Fervidobacterium sp.]